MTLRSLLSLCRPSVPGRCLCLALLPLLATPPAAGQLVNASQQVLLQGLRASHGYGSFTAAQYGPDGSLYLLLDEHDGVRVLKTDGTASTLLAQTQAGAVGDSGVAMAIDPAGNVYVAGTSTSHALSGTSGVVYPTVADSSTNSFVAKYDANLNLIFLTFLGSGRTVVSGVAATADAVFVTGVTFNGSFPVTAGGIQQSPAAGSTENGFVERFSSDGTVLSYATYLTGAGGNTVPAGIVADATDAAYIAGTTSATGYPTVAALQPRMLLPSGGSTSGFLTKLTANGSSLVFSTFIAGNGLTGLALDPATATLLLSGNVAPGQFPVATVAMPLASTGYQTLLRLPTDGQSVSQSVLLTAGTQSSVSADANGAAWVAGSLSTPLFPGAAPPDYSDGDSFLVHVTAQGVLDQTLRFGGLPVENASYASLTSTLQAPAVGTAGVVVPGMVTASASAALTSETYDLPLVQAPNAVLPNSLADVLAGAAPCTGSVCTASAALLARVSTTAGASLSLSANDAPNVTVRNLGSVEATGLAIATSGLNETTDCGATLAPSTACHIAVSGGPGSISVSAANAPTQTVALPATSAAAAPLGLSSRELDFGIVSAASPATTETLTVTNLTGVSQSFSAARDAGPSSSVTAAVSGTDCGTGATAGTYLVAANSTCHLTLAISASGTSTNDGPFRLAWKVGTQDVVLTGFAQAAALSLSSSELDFGLQFSAAGALSLPRYLYVSNNSASGVAHAAVSLPAGSPFQVVDGCPSTLEAHSVCQLTVTYHSVSAASSDSATLTLDGGLSVLLTGETEPPAAATGSTANPSLRVSTTALSFATPVVVTGLSATTQTVTLTNAGVVALPLLVAISSEFTLTDGCPATLGAGASCSLLVGFAPAEPGVRQGVLSITAGSGFSPMYVALSGTGTAILPANNGTLDSGQTLVGEPAVAWYQVQQALTTLTATATGAAFGVAFVQDTGSGHGSLPSSAFAASATAACSNCWLGVQFLPSAAGAQSGALSLSTVSGGTPEVLQLTGTALASQGLILSPVIQDFGPVAVHSASAPVSFLLTNALATGQAVTLQSITASGDFVLSSPLNGGAPCAGTLAATASCFVSVSFVPTDSGARTGTLTMVTSGGTVSAALSGFGEPDPGVSLSPTALNFNSEPGAAATQGTVTLSNTGSGVLSVGSVDVSGAGFSAISSCGAVPSGGSCAIDVQFTPQSSEVSGAMSVPVTATVNGQSVTTTYTVPLTGSYAASESGLEIVANEVNFGSTVSGTSAGSRQFTLNNLSGEPLTVTLQMPRQFPLASSSPCTTLAAGGSCTFSVSFVPETAGAATGTVLAQGVTASGTLLAQSLSYMLGYSTGSGRLTVGGDVSSTATLDFGQVSSGQQIQKTALLVNSGSTPMTIRRLTSEPPFLSTSNCGSQLAPGASCSVTLTYAPVDEVSTGSSALTRSEAGTLVIESDAASSPDVVTLTGTAQPITSSSPSSGVVLATYSLSESALTFGNTAVGGVSAAQSVTLTNTGTTTLHIASVLPSTDFTAATTCATLLPGNQCTVTAAFAPTTAGSGTPRAGTLEILSDAGTSLEFISLIGVSAPAPLTLTPTALDFGTIALGRTATQSVTVTNSSNGPVTLTGLTATGDYTVAAGGCSTGTALAVGASCQLAVTFQPSASGIRPGVLSVASDATQVPLTVSLTGVGAQVQLEVSPGALNFGSVAEGAMASLQITLTNTGTSDVTAIANALSGAGAAQFAVTVPCAYSTLTPGQSCTETVTFLPTGTGALSATLSIASSDPGGPALVQLSGTGVQAGSFVLTVNGGSSATAAVTSGSPATFALTLTPLNGFTGPVALTCTPVTPVPYATCSLLSSTLTLNGSAAGSTATLNTITSAAKVTGGLMASLLLLPFASAGRRRMWRRVLMAALLTGAALLASTGLTGCGGTSQIELFKTPPGTYQYQVTASSTGGVTAASTVTLNLVVQ